MSKYLNVGWLSAHYVFNPEYKEFAVSIFYLSIGIVGGIGAMITIILAFSWVFARLWCTPKHSPSIETPEDYHLPFEEVHFFSKGVAIRGWFIPLSFNPSRDPAIIVAHGWSSCSARMLPIARTLHEAGFGVFMFDARGHGSSSNDGPITILKMAEDIIAGIDYLEKRSDVDMTRLGLIGHSLGGAAAILAASKDPRISSLVSSSAFADPESLTHDYMRKMHIPAWPIPWLVCRVIEGWLGTRIKKVAPQNRIGKIGVPLLLIHGDSDQFIPSDNLDTLFAHANKDLTERLMIPGRGHSNIKTDVQCAKGVKAFFQRNLSGAHEGTSLYRFRTETSLIASQ